MSRRIRIQIGWEQDGSTIQSVLREAGFSRHQIRSLKFRERGICVNGIQKRVTDCLKSGDCLELLIEDGKTQTDGEPGVKEVTEVTEERAVHPEVLYEDEDLLLINKPAGIPTHPGRGHYRDSAADLAGRIEQKRDGAAAVTAQRRAVGRLDKETSGVLVFAKHRMAAARLARQREQGQMVKEYAAVVHGVPKLPAGWIELPIGKVPGSLNRMEVRPDGKYAATYYEVLRNKADSALVLCRLKTGRTHQIRVHMAAIGHPLFCDSLYGADGSNGMAALHAWKVRMLQPFTGEEICVTAPIYRTEFKEQGYEL